MARRKIDELELAKILHECGREAVLKKQMLNVPELEEIEFIEWDDLPHRAKNGRVLQAQALLKRFSIFPKVVKKSGFE
jgi:hypothetical protein